MLKCNVKKGGMVFVKAKGTVDNLVPETAVVVQAVYLGIRNKNPEEAKEFKNRMIGLLLDPASPVWQEGGHGD